MSDRHEPSGKAKDGRSKGAVAQPRLLPEHRGRGWADVDEADQEQPFKTLSRDEARDLMARHPSTSPWRVVAVQAVVGVLLASAVGLYSGEARLGWSALYGAAAVVLPAALMARGMTSQLSSMTPGVSAVSFMLWEFGKIAVSVLMLMLAPKLVRELSWPALLVTLIVCINLYWVALPWQRRGKS
jgi:ATP synthase protein I